MYYLRKFCPNTTDVCESIRKLTSARTEWTWNKTYQKIFNNPKLGIREDACMKIYDEAKPLYTETDAPEAGLGAAILQTRSSTSCTRDESLENSILKPIAFMSRRLSMQKKVTAPLKKKHLVHYKD